MLHSHKIQNCNIKEFVGIGSTTATLSQTTTKRNHKLSAQNNNYSIKKDIKDFLLLFKREGKQKYKQINKQKKSI